MIGSTEIVCERLTGNADICAHQLEVNLKTSLYISKFFNTFLYISIDDKAAREIEYLSSR